MTVKKVFGILKQTFKCFGDDNVMRLGASLAYYAMFSIGPLLFIMLILAGAIFGEQTVKQTLHQQISSMVGQQAGSTIDSMMSARKFTGSTVTTIIGIITLVFGATGVFGELQSSLNTIWDVKAKPTAGIWSYVRNRFLSMGMVLGLGFLLLISMVLTTAAESASKKVSGFFHVPDQLVTVVSAATAFVIVIIFFALVFKFLPDVKVRWRPVLIGAIVTAALFTGGKYLLSLYLGKQATTSSYGAAGSVVVILLWVYYASLIMFMGAEFTQVYANETGEAIVPNKYAVPADQEGNPAATKHDERDPRVQELTPQKPPPIAAMIAFAVGLGAAFGFRRKR